MISQFPSFGHRRWKAPVGTAGQLPSSGNKPGDVRLVIDTMDIKGWNGSSWVSLGGGGGGAAFMTIQPDSGTAPVATGQDTLTMTSSDTSLDISGDSSTDTIDFKISQAFIYGMFSATSPLSFNSLTGEFSISQASTSTDGYLSATDWNTFNGKVSTSRNVSAGAGLTGGGDLSADRTLALNIFGQTENTTPAGDDWAIVENNSGGTLRKVKLSNIGGQLNGLFGNGVDGDATISGDGALSGNMYYNNLTVNSAVNLSVPCFKIFVKGTLTNNGRIYTSVGSGAGATPLGKGSNRGNSNSGSGNAGSNNLWGIGGVGGTGGDGAGGTGGAGGSVGGSYTAASGSGKHLFDLINAVVWPTPPGQTPGPSTTPGGGSGGGGGAGSGSSAGGRGGHGAGSMLVVAQYLTGTGTFEAVGEDASPADGNNEGGGGGGGGGLVILVSRTALASTSLSVNVNGGLGGAGMGTGTNGTNGGVGVFVDFTGIV